METLELLRRQIETATDLNSVVSTMKTLAAVSIHQYEQAVTALRDYNRTIELGLQMTLRGGSFQPDTHPGGHTAAIVFGSDQGMCGQFNEDIVQRFHDTAPRASNDQPWTVLVVGHRAEGQLLDSGWALNATYDVPTSVSDITNLVLELLPAFEQLRRAEQVERLQVFYNRRRSASTFEPQSVQLLPLSPDLVRRWRGRAWDSRSLPMLAAEASTLLPVLVHQYLFVGLFRACAESLASENASRIAAMQAAEKNIEERLEELRGAYNQQRQTAITEELLDVVTGFEALSQQR